MTPAERKAHQQAAVRAYNNSREADRLGLRDVAQRHWEACVRALLREKGEPIPPSLEPGEPAPKP